MRDGAQIKLIDYGISDVCSSEDDERIKRNMAIMYRWFAWEFLWILTSHEGPATWSMRNDNVWQQPPDGFKPFFQHSSMRHPAYQTQAISAGMIETEMGEDFFKKIMSPKFQTQFPDAQAAQKLLSAMLGELFFETAKASDLLATFQGDFNSLLSAVREISALATAK